MGEGEKYRERIDGRWRPFGRTILKACYYLGDEQLMMTAQPCVPEGVSECVFDTCVMYEAIVQ